MSVHFIPLGAFAMVVLIVAITTMSKMREKELNAHQRSARRKWNTSESLKSWRLKRPK